MRIKSGYILREVAGNNVVIPIGEETIKFNGVITISGSGAFLWKKLSDGDVSEAELVAALLDEYEVDEQTANADVKEFIANIKERGLFE